LRETREKERANKMAENLTLENLRMPGAAPNAWSYPTFLAIGPKGETAVRHLEPNKLGEMGDVPIKVESGIPHVSEAYKARGWVSYEDLCKGKVEGVEADPVAWIHWTSVCQLRAAGRDREIHWHPEIARRAAGGGSTAWSLPPEQEAYYFPTPAESIPSVESNYAPSEPGQKKGKG
jgi:hypothetical protein